jgi:hypothetical protein
MTVLLAAAACTHLRSPESSASDESYPVWIALIKGFHGEVRYVGSDESHAYFRVGRVFWSYYRLPACAAQLPEVLSVRDGRSYVVRLHVGPDNHIDIEKNCPGPADQELGRLDRL